MSDMIQKCPDCEKKTWFSFTEYSKDHLQMICEECGCEIYSDLDFHKVQE